MKQKTKLIGIIVILIILLAGAFILYQNLSKKYTAGVSTEEASSNDDTEKQEPVTAPDFTAENAKGKPVSFFSMTGKKPVVLNFWASWCPPCKQEMPGFEAMYKKYSDKVEFVMVNMTDGARETKKKASTFIKNQGYTFPVYYDTEQEAAYNYQAESLPTTYFINKDGEIVSGARGAMEESALESEIQKLIKE